MQCTQHVLLHPLHVLASLSLHFLLERLASRRGGAFGAITAGATVDAVLRPKRACPEPLRLIGDVGIKLTSAARPLDLCSSAIGASCFGGEGFRLPALLLRLFAAGTGIADAPEATRVLCGTEVSQLRTRIELLPGGRRAASRGRRICSAPLRVPEDDESRRSRSVAEPLSPGANGRDTRGVRFSNGRRNGLLTAGSCEPLAEPPGCSTSTHVQYTCSQNSHR